MIIIPNLDRATFIRKEMFCTISGLPNQIVEKFLMADTHIDESISIVSQTIPDIQILNTGDISVSLYQEAFDQNHIKYSIIERTSLSKFFKETKWTD